MKANPNSDLIESAKIALALIFSIMWMVGAIVGGIYIVERGYSRLGALGAILLLVVMFIYGATMFFQCLKSMFLK